MDFRIERIEAENYGRFADMVYWRENGCERTATSVPTPERIREELSNPDLFVYAVEEDGRYVGWISLIYLPKVGKWHGRGHIYVDELWVEPSHRGRGLAKALMRKADEMKDALGAVGIRLYVNEDNPAARQLYARCGYREVGRTVFMEK